MKVVELRKEEMRLRKLVNTARPAHTPEVEPYDKYNGKFIFYLNITFLH